MKFLRRGKFSPGTKV